MKIFLIWILFPGGWAVTGPTQVMATQGGSLVVSCSYEPHYKLYPKYWCRPDFLWICFTNIAQTNGSEGTVTQDRVSIGDNHVAHSFTLMLEGVTPEDAGWYSCRVRRRLWFSLWHDTEVMVSTAVSTTTRSSSVSLLDTNTHTEEHPVLSQLSVTNCLLLLLGMKVSVALALALACGATWVRRQCRSRNQENLQLLEVTDTTGTPDCSPTLDAQGHPPAPSPPTLPGLLHPPQPPCSRGCSALGSSPLGKP
ncbi:protein CD300H-like [Heliangelus exortis]|uniref:protein CD300H-like n=1 Tax=Heliangelus exortis TaxID=472823 RepID=UPI003A959AB8